MKILYYDGKDHAKGKRVQSIIESAKLSLILIKPDQGAATIAELLEGNVTSCKPLPLPTVDLMIFEGFNDEAIMELSALLKQNNVLIERKCIVTKHNRNWTFARLLTEIQAEQAYMNSVAQCRSLLQEVSNYQESDYTPKSWQRYELAFMSAALLLQQEHTSKEELDTLIQTIIQTRDQLVKK